MYNINNLTKFRIKAESIEFCFVFFQNACPNHFFPLETCLWSGPSSTLKTLPRVGMLSYPGNSPLQSPSWKIRGTFSLLSDLTNYPQRFAHQVSPFTQSLSLKHGNVLSILWDLNTPKSLISLFINTHKLWVRLYACYFTCDCVDHCGVETPARGSFYRRKKVSSL